MKLSSLFNHYPNLRSKILSSQAELDSYGYPVDLTLGLLQTHQYNDKSEVFYTQKARFSKALFFDEFIFFLIPAFILYAILSICCFMLFLSFQHEYNIDNSSFFALFIIGLLFILCLGGLIWTFGWSIKGIKNILFVKSKIHYWDKERVYSKSSIEDLYQENARNLHFKYLNESKENFETLVFNIPYIVFLEKYFPKSPIKIKFMNKKESLIYLSLRDYSFLTSSEQNILKLFFKNKVKQILNEDMTYRTLILWKILFYQVVYLKLIKRYGENHEICNDFISLLYQIDFPNERFELPESGLLSYETIDFVLKNTIDNGLKNIIKQYFEF